MAKKIKINNQGPAKKKLSPDLTKNNTGILFLYIFLLSVTFLITYIYIYDPKIGLSGDNMDYYILGKSIASGKGYCNISHPSEMPANHFPPGYPFIISLLLLIKDNVATLKIANGVFYFFSIILSFFIFRKITGNSLLAFVTSLIVLVNFHLLSYATDEMSEIPYLFFASLTVYLMMNLDTAKPIFKNPAFFLLIFCLSFSYYIRTAGISLVFGVCFYFAWQKNWKYVGATLGLFILSVLPWTIRGISLGGNSYTNQLMMINPYNPELGMAGPMDIVNRFLNNLQRYFAWEFPSACFPFIYKNNPLTYEGKPFGVDYAIGTFTLLLILFGLYKLSKYRSFIISYFIGTMGVLLFWPDVWFGIRFILPAAPLMVFCFLVGLSESVQFIISKLKPDFKLSPLLLLPLLLFYLPMLPLMHQKALAPYPVQFMHYFDIAKWAKTNTPEKSIFCCRKQSLFYYFSKRYCVNYAYSLDDKAMLKDLEDKKVNYVVLEQLGFASTGKYLYPTIQKNPQKFPVILHIPEPDTYLLGFNP